MCEEPEQTGIFGSAGGDLLQVRTGEGAAASLPPADRQDEGPGLRHAARSITLFPHKRQVLTHSYCFCFSFTDPETAQKALQLVHGYQGLGKPLVVEFGRVQQEGGQQMK